MTTLYFVTGDNKAVRSWVVRRTVVNATTGEVTNPPVDLTNATAAEIHIIGAATPTVAVQFVTDATGSVSHSFLASEIPAGANPARAYDFETQVTFSDGTVTTFPDPGFDTVLVRNQGG